MDYLQILDKLKSLTDEKYRQFHAKLVPNIDNILGVRMPELKKLAKQIAKEDAGSFLSYQPKNTYEEITLEGLVIGYRKCGFAQKLDDLRNFVPKITNWATCDCCCANLKDIAKHKPEMLCFIDECLRSDAEYTLRFAVVSLLDFYIDEQYIDAVLARLSAVRSDDYYVKMAVAWALSVCAVKFPEKTKKVIDPAKLDDFTYKKTLQKIKESKRTPTSKKTKTQ